MEEVGRRRKRTKGDRREGDRAREMERNKRKKEKEKEHTYQRTRKG